MNAEPKWDAFISHASEDKAAIARPLANLLAAHGLRIWLDEAEIFLGDSLRKKIDEGLARSRFGVVILSKAFFAKKWTQAELDGLFALEDGSGPVILPIWHELSFQEVLAHLPLLAGRLAVSTDQPLQVVAQKIVKAIDMHGRPVRSYSPIFAGRLTKRALMELPEGAFLQSNVRYTADGTPGIAETVPANREELWSKLAALKLNGTRFYAYRDADAYRMHAALHEEEKRLLGFKASSY